MCNYALNYQSSGTKSQVQFYFIFMYFHHKKPRFATPKHAMKSDNDAFEIDNITKSPYPNLLKLCQCNG